MLVLSRAVGERIRIGTDVVVTIVEAHGSRVRVGIDAPKDLRIERLAPDPGFAPDSHKHGRAARKDRLGRQK